MSTIEKTIPKIGRSTRLHYWLIMFFFISPILFILEYSSSWVAIVAVIVLSIPVINVQIGRWHDLGYSGWLTLLGFIPVVGLIASIPLCFVKGNQKDNKYGPSPYVDKYHDYET